MDRLSDENRSFSLLLRVLLDKAEKKPQLAKKRLFKRSTLRLKIPSLCF